MATQSIVTNIYVFYIVIYGQQINILKLILKPIFKFFKILKC